MSGFSYQKVSQFINRMERDLNQIRGWGKKLATTYENTQEDLGKLLENRREMGEKYRGKDKEG